MAVRWVRGAYAPGEGGYPGRLGSPSHHEAGGPWRPEAKTSARGRSLLCSSAAAPGGAGEGSRCGDVVRTPQRAGRSADPSAWATPEAGTARTKETGNSGAPLTPGRQIFQNLQETNDSLRSPPGCPVFRKRSQVILCHEKTLAPLNKVK